MGLEADDVDDNEHIRRRDSINEQKSAVVTVNFYSLQTLQISDRQ